ncbi:hypothetical protein KC19_1G044200 [Ceratodon purpureus]|uniref:Secreted protein n=1 Tax=Ceratodon purpureus TaxID=3225 RepID=A0A8T0J4Q2_CERPU|nr:hypothetical protein KC19_1G044200 [Ceratodon purpureus]
MSEVLLFWSIYLSNLSIHCQAHPMIISQSSPPWTMVHQHRHLHCGGNGREFRSRHSTTISTSKSCPLPAPEPE